jgi:hypothetical protein
VRPSAARLRWLSILATTGAICAVGLAATAGAVMDGFFTVPWVIATAIGYAVIASAWGNRRFRVATLRAASLCVGAAMAAVLLAVIPLDANGYFDLILFGPSKNPNRLPFALPIAVVLAGMAFVIGRRQSLNLRDGNALLAIQVPMVGFCVWLAGRLPPSPVTPLIILCGAGLVIVGVGVLLVAPRTPFLADEEIPAIPVSRAFVWFSVAAMLFGLAAPFVSYGTVDLRLFYRQLFFAAGVLPLSIFSVLHQRAGGALSSTVRGLAYGCAVLIAAVIGSLFGFVTFTLLGLAIFHVPEQYLRVAVVCFCALPSGVLATGVIYLRSPGRRTWHPIAPLIALQLSWIASAALVIPSAFVGVLSIGQNTVRTPGYLLTLSAAASIAAVVSARASVRRSTRAGAIALAVSNVGART